MDVARAARLAREGLELWEARRLADAVERYKEALAHADPEHYATPAYHQELASVLAALGNDNAALSHFHRALELERNRGRDDAAVTVAVARYFLAEQHAKMRQPVAGLEVIAPSLAAGGNTEALLQMVQAECLWQLGQLADAKAAAQRAVTGAASADQRERMAERLAMVLGNDGPPE